MVSTANTLQLNLGMKSDSGLEALNDAVPSLATPVNQIGKNIHAHNDNWPLAQG